MEIPRNSLSVLSNDVLRIVMQYMDTRTLTLFGACCIRFKDMADTELWRSVTVVCEQMPLARNTRIRVELNKLFQFTRFCYDLKNRVCLDRVSTLRLSVPMDIDTANPKPFERQIKWFVENLGRLFRNVEHLEVFTVAKSEITTRSLINKALALPQRKRVLIKYPSDCKSIDPVGKIVNCESLVVRRPVEGKFEELLPLDTIRDVECLDVACEGYAEPFLIDAAFCADTLGRCDKMKELRITRGRFQQGNAKNWVPPNLQKLVFEDTKFEMDWGCPMLSAHGVKTLEVNKVGAMGDGTFVPFACMMFPGLENLVSNFNFSHMLQAWETIAQIQSDDGQRPLAHVSSTSSRHERTVAALKCFEPRSFECFLGRLGELDSRDLKQLAQACHTVESLRVCVIPGFGMQLGGGQSHVQDASSDTAFNALESILNVFLNACPRLCALYLVDVEGLEHRGLAQGWLADCTNDNSLGLLGTSVRVASNDGILRPPVRKVPVYKLDIARFRDYTTRARPAALPAAAPPAAAAAAPPEATPAASQGEMLVGVLN